MSNCSLTKEESIKTLAEAGGIHPDKVQFIWDRAIEAAAERCEREAAGLEEHGLGRMALAAKSCATNIRQMAFGAACDVVPIGEESET